MLITRFKYCIKLMPMSIIYTEMAYPKLNKQLLNTFRQHYLTDICPEIISLQKEQLLRDFIFFANDVQRDICTNILY